MISSPSGLCRKYAGWKVGSTGPCGVIREFPRWTESFPTAFRSSATSASLPRVTMSRGLAVARSSTKREAQALTAFDPAYRFQSFSGTMHPRRFRIEQSVPRLTPWSSRASLKIHPAFLFLGEYARGLFCLISSVDGAMATKQIGA